jgi:hypothetical protein
MNESNISLKIIRLSKPSLDKQEQGELLSLPATFGSIYLGQEFEALLVLNNESHGEEGLKDVLIKAELQTTNSRFSCLDSKVNLDKSMNFIIKHEIKELGIHILVCTLTFNGKIQRKFYKFQVLNPLSLKLSSVASQDGIYIQISLCNISNFSLVLKSFKFLSVYTLTDLNSFLKQVIIPRENRVYLYYLESLQVENLGKCDISWTFDNGSVGRLVTADLLLKNNSLENESTSLAPRRVIVEEKFTIKIKDNGKVEQLNYKQQILLVKEEKQGSDLELSFLALYPGFYSLKLTSGKSCQVVDLLIINEFPVQV